MADEAEGAGAFTSQEKQRVRRLLADSRAALDCPRCGGELSLGVPMVGGTQGDYWEITCRDCGRRMIAGARHVPPDRRPKG